MSGEDVCFLYTLLKKIEVRCLEEEKIVDKCKKYIENSKNICEK